MDCCSAKVLYIDGRQFPVDVLYTKEPQLDYLHAAYAAIIQTHMEHPPGDILVFLTGWYFVFCCSCDLFVV
jgi:HrpA-like RNA helicase